MTTRRKFLSLLASAAAALGLASCEAVAAAGEPKREACAPPLDVHAVRPKALVCTVKRPYGEQSGVYLLSVINGRNGFAHYLVARNLDETTATGPSHALSPGTIVTACEWDGGHIFEMRPSDAEIWSNP